MIESACSGCGACIALCPTHAIALADRWRGGEQMPEERRYHYISSAVVAVMPGRIAEVAAGDCAHGRH